MNSHQKYIQRCIELAKNGLGSTYPNPLVGSVIVCDGKIIGEGWHQKAGMPHAEVNAINAVEEPLKLKESTIYVSLEPCVHFGKTPPCSHLIVEKGIKNVVVGTLDSNVLVRGKGIEYLRNHGCNVTVGILEDDCEFLNKRFFTFHNKKRPYIVLKWAETKDGFIDTFRNEDAENKPNWISNTYSQQLVHKMRVEEQAILVGTNTALNDNPLLTARSWQGNQPIRIVLDRTLKIPKSYRVFNNATKTIVITEVTNKKLLTAFDNIQYECIDFSQKIIPQLCNVLYKNNIQSLIVEGGKQILQTFINENCWDEAHIFTGDICFEEGLKAPKIKGQLTQKIDIKSDTLKIYTSG